jgi:hypothetical protein
LWTACDVADQIRRDSRWISGQLEDDENGDEVLKYIASPDTLKESRTGTMFACKPGLLVLSQSSIGLQVRLKVPELKTSAENGMVPEAACKERFCPPTATLE